MPSCKECIHEKLCILQYGEQVKNWAEKDGCKHFTDKADYDREQYKKGYYDGMSDMVEKIKEKFGKLDKFIPQKNITITGLQLNNLLKEMAGENN